MQPPQQGYGPSPGYPPQQGYPPPQGGPPGAPHGYPPPQVGGPPPGQYPPPAGYPPPAQPQFQPPPAQGAPQFQGGAGSVEGGSQRAIENEIPENMEETGNANMANEIPEEVNMNNKANMENVIMSEEIQLETVPVNMVKDTEIVADSVTMVTAWKPGDGGVHQWEPNSLPDKPLPDNPDAQPPPYQPPSMAGFDRFPGYENVGEFGQALPTAPPPPLPPLSGEPPPMSFDSMEAMTETQCREALLAFVAENCCYGKKAAEDMKITEVQPTTALHYTLETFAEERSTGYAFEPYRGGVVDGPHNGYPPPPWDIPCQPTQQFNHHVIKCDVPHTSTVQPCNRCMGMGFVRCHRCHGLGRVRCTHCHGDGRVSRMRDGQRQIENCHWCHGDGRKRCMTCHGDGRVTCHTCQGFRQIRCFIQLTVTYHNHKGEHIMEKTDMPDELVRTVGGMMIFEQVLPQVWPIIAFPVQEINMNSQRLVDQHRQQWNNQRKLNQRQQLRAVPVTEVHYTWKDTASRFWVYGQERKVHAPDYPQQCCWGCQIL